MSIQTIYEAICCCYSKLTTGIITDFYVMEDLSMHQFVLGKRQKKTSLHLMAIRQKKNMSLADYIKRFKRFNEKSLNI